MKHYFYATALAAFLLIPSLAMAEADQWECDGKPADCSGWRHGTGKTMMGLQTGHPTPSVEDYFAAGGKPYPVGRDKVRVSPTQVAQIER